MAEILTLPDLEMRLRAAWPGLPADERQLILDLVWATAGPDSALAEVIDDLEATLAYDAARAVGDTGRPWEEVMAEINAERQERQAAP